LFFKFSNILLERTTQWIQWYSRKTTGRIRSIWTRKKCNDRWFKVILCFWQIFGLILSSISSGQIEAYKGQVQQFSKTIIQLEKNLAEEQEKRVQLQTEFDTVGKNGKGIYLRNKSDKRKMLFFYLVKPPTPPASVETVVPVVPVLTGPVVDLRLVCACVFFWSF
jgi:hypothetical protein